MQDRKYRERTGLFAQLYTPGMIDVARIYPAGVHSILRQNLMTFFNYRLLHVV